MINYYFIPVFFLLLFFSICNSYSSDKKVVLACDISVQESLYLLNQVRIDNKPLIRSMDDCKKSNRYFIAKVISINPYYFKFAADSLKDDEVFISKFVAINPGILQHISSRLADDQFFMFKMAKIYPEALKYASGRLLNNRGFMIKMININPKNFIYASDRLQNDKTLVLLAVKKNGKMLKFASDYIQNDKDVVIESIQSYNLAINFASQRLQNNKQIKKIASKINYGFLNNFDLFLKENYGGLDVGPKGYRGYHIVNMAKFFPEKQIVYKPYLTKWERVYKNGVATNKFELISKMDQLFDWRSAFKNYPNLMKKIEDIFFMNRVDDNTVDALNLVSFWLVSKNPKVIAFDMYLLRKIDGVYFDVDIANVVALSAIAKEKENKEWEINIVQAIFDADLKMSIAYKNGHKRYKIWDIYQENEKSKDLKILFKVEDEDGEYFDLFTKQLNDRYISIYKGGGYAMDINLFSED